MKLENIKVGDRIFYYDSNGVRFVRTVTAVNGGWVYCREKGCAGTHSRAFHGKLVKKTRREFWLNVYSGGISVHATKADADRYDGNRRELIRVIEARDQKKTK